MIRCAVATVWGAVVGLIAAGAILYVVGETIEHLTQ